MFWSTLPFIPSLPNFSLASSLLLPPNLICSLIYFLVNLWSLLSVFGMGTSVGPSPGALKNNCSSRSGSHRLPVAPHLGVGLPDVLLLHSRMLSGLILCRSCACCPNCHELMCTTIPLYPGSAVSLSSSTTSVSNRLSIPSSAVTPWALGGALWWSFSVSAHWPVVGLWADLPPLQEEMSLMRFERCTGFWVCGWALKSWFNTSSR